MVVLNGLSSHVLQACQFSSSHTVVLEQGSIFRTNVDTIILGKDVFRATFGTFRSVVWQNGQNTHASEKDRLASSARRWLIVSTHHMAEAPRFKCEATSHGSMNWEADNSAWKQKDVVSEGACERGAMEEASGHANSGTLMLSSPPLSVWGIDADFGQEHLHNAKAMTDALNRGHGTDAAEGKSDLEGFPGAHTGATIIGHTHPDSSLQENRQVILGNLADAIATKDLCGNSLVELTRKAGLSIDQRTLIHLLRHLRNGQHWEGALRARQAFMEAGMKDNGSVNTALVNILGDCLQTEEVSAMFDAKLEERKPLSVRFCNATINAFRKAQEWERVIGVFSAMREQGLPPDLYTFRAMIRTCASCGRGAECGAYFEEMVAAGFRPSNNDYSYAMLAYMKSGLTDKAIQVLEGMEASGHPPDIKYYSAAIASCQKSGRWQEALWLLARMLRAGFHPNIVTWTAVVSACASAGQVIHAEEAVRQMRLAGIEPNVVTWTTLISGYGHRTILDADAAEKAFRQMLESGVEPNQVTWSALIGVFCQSSKISKAMEALAVMREEGLSPCESAWNSVVCACARSYRWYDMVESLMADMASAGCAPSVVTYTAILNGYAHRGKWLESKAVFEHMQGVGIRPNVVTCSAMVRAYSYGNQVEQAFDFVLRMEADFGIRPDKYVYTALLKGCEVSRKWWLISKVVNHMEDVRCPPDDKVYTAIIRAYEASEKYKEAMDVLLSMG